MTKFKLYFKSLLVKKMPIANYSIEGPHTRPPVTQQLMFNLLREKWCFVLSLLYTHFGTEAADTNRAKSSCIKLEK